MTMDLHANVTRCCVEHADAIVGFRTSPHIDLRETGQRGAGVMLRMLQDGVRPAMAMVKIPMVVPASTHMHHLPGPFQRLMHAAEAAEDGSVLAASVFAVQPWLDIAEMGFATVAVTDGDAMRANRSPSTSPNWPGLSAMRSWRRCWFRLWRRLRGRMPSTVQSSFRTWRMARAPVTR